MTRKYKWVEGVHADNRAIDIARQIIRVRWDRVWGYLVLAAKRPHEDIEHVHRLRVSTRRTAAALQVFRELARKKYYREVATVLRRLRRDAGLARDLDVIRERLKQRADAASDPQIDEAVLYVAERRELAQRKLNRTYKRAKRNGWKRKIRRVVKRKLWHDTPDTAQFGDVAHSVFNRVVDAFFTAAATDPSDMDALHQVRICGKRLRYTMEIVVDVYDQSLRNVVYPEFEQAQERIGVVTDHSAAAAIFSEWCEQAKGQNCEEVFQSLMVEEQQQCEASRDELLQWWTTQRVQTLKRQFAELLCPSAASKRTPTHTHGLSANLRGGAGST